MFNVNYLLSPFDSSLRTAFVSFWHYEGKCKANAESSLLVLLSRSLYSPLQILVCKGKGTKFIFGFESSCKLLKIVAIFSVISSFFSIIFITFAYDFEKACEPGTY